MESLEAVQQTSAVILSALKAEEPVSQEVPESPQEVEEPVAQTAHEYKRARRSRTQTATTEAA
jgi:hypothetical protein